MTELIEKRRHPRLNMNLPVVLRSGGRLIPATMTDLSNNGMGIITNESIPLHTMTEVIFDIPESTKDVSVMGLVIRKEGTQNSKLGIEFTSPFSLGRTIISNYLKQAFS